MPDQGGEKTEKASPKKREDERKKGNIFTSKDVTTIVSLVVAFFAIGFFMNSFLIGLERNYIDNMNRAAMIETLRVEDIMTMAMEVMTLFATKVLPPMLIIAISVIAAVAAQTRLLFSGELIKFKANRLNPLSGLKKLISLRSLVEVLKSLIKIVLLSWLLYTNIQRTIQIAPQIPDWSMRQALQYTGNEINKLVLTTAIAFGVVAVVDYLYQRWEYEKNIRMTKQEVKDEYKQLEGNPEIKGQRRQKQREFAQRRMMQQVKDADVVVRNPTHFAVALRYRLEQDTAPVILAKGKDLVAQRIVQEAEKYGITMVENPPLARGLYDLADIDDIIPAELYQPVAELLAWLFTSKEKEMRRK